MNTPLLALPPSAATPDEIKKKRVLLIDASHAKRDMRAEVLRKLGIDVDSAADIPEARSWWRPGLYDLVLINMEKGAGHRDRFCDDLRGAIPPQRLAFLVGQPEYLAASPKLDEELSPENGDGDGAPATANGGSPANTNNGHLTPQRWGILEASRRISAVRSVSVARTQAMRSLPPPPRDSEGRPSRKTLASASLADLFKRELP